MIVKNFDFFDTSRNRKIPVMLYLPEARSGQVIIFNPGYQDQEELNNPSELWTYKGYKYLVDFFTDKGYTFISIQHDILGDNDGLETLDPKAVQAEARRHLWIRGEKNIFFVISEIKKIEPSLNFDKFIIVGHSNGGDISKFFANNNQQMIERVISLDGRRCPIKPNADLKVLMFEANDTTTDDGVIPNKGGTADQSNRGTLEWAIVKPKNATHMSYCGSETYGDKDLHPFICKAIEWFLDSF